MPVRGRPKGKADAKARVRRSTAQVAADKIALAQAKVDALRLQNEAREATRAANRKKLPPPRPKAPKPPPPPSESSESEEPPPPPKRVRVREPKRRAPSPASSSDGYVPPRPSPRSRKKALYTSWFS